MRYEFFIFIGLITAGMMSKKLDWRGIFYLVLFVGGWIFINWKKG